MLITFRLTWDLLDVVLCYVFEDTEAVIKMIIKGRSPTMRHVSRTHRVALDWLFERINLDPMIQIRYIDIKHQLADMFIKGNFTRDEWNNLLHLFYISQFSSLCFAQNFSFTCCQNDGEGDARTKRRRQECGKIKAHSTEPDFHCLDKFLTREPLHCVEKPGDTQSIYSGKPDARARRNSKPDAASSSQGRLKPRQINVRNHGNFLILNPGAVTRKKWRRNLLRSDI